MRLKTLAQDLLPLVLAIPLVMAFFRWIPDRSLAATCAGILFVGVPLALMIWELRKPRLLGKGPKILWWGGILQFWTLFALPILGARLLFWETPFEEFTFFGFPGPLWHQISSKSYSVMAVLVGTARLWAPKTKSQL